MNMANTATPPPRSNPRGPRPRVASDAFASAEEFLKAAAFIVVPEDQSQRKAFEKLMPHLYVLRDKGCSFAQLAGLLTKCGLNLQPSTVRRYFEEMLAARMDVCQKQLKEQMALLSEVRKETKQLDVSAIAGKVLEVDSKRREEANANIDRLINPGGRKVEQSTVGRDQQPRTMTSARPMQAPPEQVVQRPAPARTESVSAPKPAPTQPNQGKPSHSDHAPKPDASLVAQHAAAAAPAMPQENLRCAPIESGVPPLKKRNDVPAIFYEPGDLEHPSIPGLFLSLEQRRYGAFLELTGPDGQVIRKETMEEKRFRILWKKPIASTPTRTSDKFVTMDMTLFKGS